MAQTPLDFIHEAGILPFTYLLVTGHTRRFMSVSTTTARGGAKSLRLWPGKKAKTNTWVGVASSRHANTNLGKNRSGVKPSRTRINWDLAKATPRQGYMVRYTRGCTPITVCFECPRWKYVSEHQEGQRVAAAIVSYHPRT